MARIRIIACCSFLAFLLASTAGTMHGAALPDRVVGVKIYEYTGDLAALFAEWKRLGFNAVWASQALVSNPEFRRRARAAGILTFVILPIFHDAAVLEKHPDWYAITGSGEQALDGWVKFICPSRTDYRSKKLAEIRDFVRRQRPDGISIDFIRHFVFWETVAPDRAPSSLPQTCFCRQCLTRFQAETGVRLPGDASRVEQASRWILREHAAKWTAWKCSLITSMVREIAAQARGAQAGILVNLHAVPWRTTDFDGAIRNVAGQDFAAIAPYLDLISPMTYHHMVRQPPSWVGSVVRGLAGQVSCPVLPSIQAEEAYVKEKLSADEFENALRASLSPPSRGVVFWSWPALEKDREKRERIVLVLQQQPGNPH